MPKKEIRRRSNWYIYLVTFLVTAVALSLAVIGMQDLIFPENDTSSFAASGTADFRPNASYNSTILFMLSDAKGAIPDYYMLANYRPRDDVVVLVALEADIFAKIGDTSGTLSDIYSTGGVEGVNLALGAMLGIEIDHYIKFDKQGFIEFVNLVGTTNVNIPYNLERNDEIIFYAGSAIMDGAQIYEYVTFPRTREDKESREIVLSTVIRSFINENSRNLTSIELQSFARKIINTADTDYTFENYTSNQSAYLYTTQFSNNIAEVYVPQYITNDNGEYVIADSSVATIKERFALD